MSTSLIWLGVVAILSIATASFGTVRLLHASAKGLTRPPRVARLTMIAAAAALVTLIVLVLLAPDIVVGVAFSITALIQLVAALLLHHQRRSGR